MGVDDPARRAVPGSRDSLAIGCQETAWLAVDCVCVWASQLLRQAVACAGAEHDANRQGLHARMLPSQPSSRGGRPRSSSTRGSLRPKILSTRTKVKWADSFGRRSARSGGVAMSGRVQAWERAGRPVTRSPGRPPVGRLEHRQRFWAAIARGASSEAAAAQAGVSGPVGVRWFREGGGNTFTGEPCSHPVDLVGRVGATLDVAAARAPYQLTAKLVDVAPDGRARRICEGVRRRPVTRPTWTSAIPRTGSRGDTGCGWRSPAATSPATHRRAGGTSSRFAPAGGAAPCFVSPF